VVPAGGEGDGTLVLPDGCSDLIWELGTGAYVAGPDTGPLHTAAPPAGTVFAGVRFRPGAGGPVLGLPLSAIRDQRVALTDLLPAAGAGRGGPIPGARAVRSLPADLPPGQAAARLLDIAGQLIADQTPDLAIARATVLLRDPAARTDEVANGLELSERQFRRRCHAAVGYGPKTLQRVLRFQRFVRRVDAPGRTLDLAEAASGAGYADQPHLTRECAALSGLSPAALLRVRRPALPLAAGRSDPPPALLPRSPLDARIRRLPLSFGRSFLASHSSVIAAARPLARGPATLLRPALRSRPSR
jgi:AraC-like DNA-binding protein